MTRIFHDVRTDDGHPIQDVRVLIELYAHDGVSGDDFEQTEVPKYEITEQWERLTSEDGRWSIDLPPSEEITPAGSFYRATEFIGPGTKPITYDFRVPGRRTTNLDVAVEYDLGDVTLAVQATRATSENPAPQDAQYVIASPGPGYHSGTLPEAVYVGTYPTYLYGNGWGGLRVPVMAEEPGILGFKWMNFNPYISNNGNSALVAGKLYSAKLAPPSPADPSNMIQSIFFHVKTAGSGLTAGQNWVGLYEIGLTSTTRLTNGALDSVVTSTGRKEVNFSSVQIDPAKTYHVVFVFNGTTLPVLRTGLNSGAAMDSISTVFPKWASPFLECSHTNHTTLPNTNIYSSELTLDGSSSLWVAGA